MVKAIVFIDSEIGIEDKKIKDLGAVKYNSAPFHSPSVRAFSNYIADCDFICGHNIIHHDLKYIAPALGNTIRSTVIDTLYLSPLLFPQKPYHALLKDDKLQSDELNNPLNDAEKAQKLFHDEENAFYALSQPIKQIFYGLLNQTGATWYDMERDYDSSFFRDTHHARFDTGALVFAPVMADLIIQELS